MISLNKSTLGMAATFAGVAAAGTLAARTTGAGSTRTDAIAGGVGAAGALGSLALKGSARGFGIAAGLGLAAAAGVDLLLGHAKGTPPQAAAGTTLLPDGEQFTPGTVELKDGTLSFDSEVANTGQAPLELALNLDEEGATTSVNQVMFDKDGSKSLKALNRTGFEADTRPDHDHLHFDDFVYFQLYKADSHGAATGDEITQGVKQSFFITDVTSVNGVPAANRALADTLPGKGNVDPTGLHADVVQGISVGKADVYGAGLDGQSLKVGNLAPGTYVLRQTFDPNDEVKELDERNDSRDTTIKVSADQKVTVVKSELVGADQYSTLKDGRQVLSSVVDSMQRYYQNTPVKDED